ncbi:MAG: T9SS type A sorting domain-containing protein [Chitinophagales bacterium]|nr:T9SS type A sorting domain-containing protein [Chitinophagales bacterium]
MNIKKTIFPIVALIVSTMVQTIYAQEIYIPDGTFKNRLLSAGIDKNGDGEIQESEALEVTKINIGLGGILSVEGLQYFKNLIELSITGNRLQTIDLTNLTKLESLNLNWNNLSGLDVNQLSNLRFLNCGRNYITTLDINNLSKLTTIYTDDSYNLLNVNLSNLPSLKTFSSRYGEKLSSLNLTNLDSLENVDCTGNKLSNLSFNNTKNIKQLSLYQNSLSNIDLSELVHLEGLSIGRNGLIELDLSGAKNLKVVNCEENKIKNLNISNLQNLTYLSCYSNLLTTLDLSNNPILEEIIVFDNPLISVILKNGIDNTTFPYFEEYFNIFNRTPSLKYVCADKEELEMLRQMALGEERDDIILTSFCNSSAGGSFYNIQGQSKLDLSGQGCKDNNSIFPHLKIEIKSLTDSGILISNNQGNFSTDLMPGTYTLTPLFENSYFSTTPASSTFIIPDTIIPTLCISSKGNFNDLAVSIIPVRAARPGFSDAQYKIVYKNQGTTTQSGSVTFHFDDNKMNSISSSPVADQSDFGLLTFNFTNLAPFESRSALITMRTNAPTDNPAVNVNDVLNFSVNITAQTDETPDDNTAILYQTVIGSYDPNDKTCLEGDIITPDMVGKRVNYLIRFENTGTAPAENVVVTDYIDTTVFDVNSLLVTSASHICHTQISNENKVQFIFSDIQLPFTEPDKHGYVAFSIQLKDHLQIGDSIKNYADIYFDYNLPVTTNEAVSEIKNKVITSVKQKISNIQLSVYPNPSKGNFYVELKSNTNRPIQVNVIDIEGKIVFTKQYKDRQILSIQLDRLAKGTYLVQAQRGNDIVSKKIVIQ